MTEAEKIREKVDAAFANQNTTLQEWKELETEMLQINKNAKSKGEDVPFLEMVSMMADPIGKEDNNVKR